MPRNLVRGDQFPIDNRQLPYPVYLLLRGKKCVLICDSERASLETERRVSLLEQSGASIAQLTSSETSLEKISDAFLVLAESRHENAVSAENLSPPREFLGDAQAGEFVTPQLVMDDGLIIGISTSEENPKERDKALRVRAQLAASI